jgi:hypothetical protein
VQLEGTCSETSTKVLDGVEKLTFELNVPGGLRPVTVYADRKFFARLTEMSGRNVIVYGKTLMIESRSRTDRGFTGATLAVQLHRVELAR